jgi:hypothetical protein
LRCVAVDLDQGMKDVLRRLAIVAWWIGAAVAGFAIAAAVVVILEGRTKDAFEALALATLPITLPCWIVAYVLGGSFWRPPAKP